MEKEKLLHAILIRHDLLIKAYLENLENPAKLRRIFELIRHTDAEILKLVKNER